MTLIKRIREYEDGAESVSRLHHAWQLLTKCAAVALNYDARIVPGPALALASSLLSSALDAGAQHIIGGDEFTHAQIPLAGVFGGFGLRKCAELSRQPCHAWKIMPFQQVQGL